MSPERPRGRGRRGSGGGGGHGEGGPGQAGPSQRQLRVAEQIRHILGMSLLRGDLHAPELAGRSITVSEVRVSRDLRAATAFASELGRALSPEAAAALKRAAGLLAGRVAREMNLKYAPRLEFVPDALFDQAAHLEQVLSGERARSGLDAAAAAPAAGEDEDAGT